MSVKKSGVVFTPKYISDFMVNFIPKKSNLKILEPSCGEGVFLNSILETNIDYKSVEANDINNDFIKTCKEKYNKVVYYNNDFIDFDKEKKYDIIIGNPPYVRIQNLEKELVCKIKKEYNNISGNLDLYIYFIIKCVDMLSDGGKLIFIVPNSFLYNKSCCKIKQYMIDNRYLEYVIDFKSKQIFPGYSMYTCIIVINKNNKDREFYNYSNDLSGDYEKILYKSVIIEDSLLNYINVKNGLATLADNIFIFDKTKLIKEDINYIYFERNKKDYKVEKTILQKVLKVSKNKEMYIITPYINGKIMDNIDNFPECKRYLEDFKTELEKRDKGNKKYERWYAYGRKQGLNLKSDDKRLFISGLVKDISGSIIEKRVELFYSGLCIEIKDNSKIKKGELIKILKEKESVILKKCNVKSNGWYSINRSSFDIEIKNKLLKTID